jgi:drug/metabolite transporter (DMT)-like permease
LGYGRTLDTLLVSSRLRADLLLFLVAAIWGSAFIAQRVGMDHVGPLAFNGVRFALGAIALLPLAVYRRHRTPGDRRPWRRDLSPGALLGGILFAGATLQQWGLVYTTAGKAGFITGLYVVLTPILGLLVGQRTSRRTWTGGLLAAVGLYLLSVTAAATIAPGDGLVLISSVFWAAHVVCVGCFARDAEPVGLACMQFAVCAGLSLLAAVFLEDTSVIGVQGALGAILYAGLLSTGVGYTLQVVAQRSAPPGHAAIILSLEAVFATAAGMLLLDEALSMRGAAGCVLMLAGMVWSQTGSDQHAGTSTSASPLGPSAGAPRSGSVPADCD